MKRWNCPWGKRCGINDVSCDTFSKRLVCREASRHCPRALWHSKRFLCNKFRNVAQRSSAVIEANFFDFRSSPPWFSAPNLEFFPSILHSSVFHSFWVILTIVIIILDWFRWLRYVVSLGLDEPYCLILRIYATFWFLIDLLWFLNVY